MNSRLFKRLDDKNLIELFSNLQNRLDVSKMLEVDDKTLIYYLYRQDKNYKSFKLRKKSGGYRIINAPISNLKIIQTKLNHILRLVCKDKKIIRKSVHGFQVNRNIIKIGRASCKERV